MISTPDLIAQVMIEQNGLQPLVKYRHGKQKNLMLRTAWQPVPEWDQLLQNFHAALWRYATGEQPDYTVLQNEEIYNKVMMKLEYTTL